MQSHRLLRETSLSLDFNQLLNILVNVENVLIIQDLDGVCMGLVKDPLQRSIDRTYVEAAAGFSPHFYVLTNGEHIGTRGVNRILEKAFGHDAYLKRQGRYLPGLAAGGVQWQDRFGQVSHPGVSHHELAFLQAIPDRLRDRLQTFCSHHITHLEPTVIDGCIDASVLDNVASPTANLNSFYETLQDQPTLYAKLQDDMKALMDEFLEDAAAQGLSESFFVHYAPNLGRDEAGLEIMRPATGMDSGTTDFQFMLRGAVKEAGVPVILNHYYYQRTGTYPLGAAFNARQAPQDHDELLGLIKTAFDPFLMPIIVGVGDTVNSQVVEQGDTQTVRRGGSDRNFLQLIQDIGHSFQKGNIVVYVDSSQGEVKNRRQVSVEQHSDGSYHIVQGPCDPQDTDDPLQLNLVFPGGHQQYSEVFRDAAAARKQRQRTLRQT
jgi:glucosylglycerol 3-phosphatase